MAIVASHSVIRFMPNFSACDAEVLINFRAGAARASPNLTLTHPTPYPRLRLCSRIVRGSMLLATIAPYQLQDFGR